MCCCMPSLFATAHPIYESRNRSKKRKAAAGFLPAAVFYDSIIYIFVLLHDFSIVFDSILFAALVVGRKVG